MTRMNTAKGSHPFIQTSQPRLFDNMARMLDPFKCSAITLMPPHNRAVFHIFPPLQQTNPWGNEVKDGPLSPPLHLQKQHNSENIFSIS